MVSFFVIDSICYFSGATLNLAEKASYWYLPAGSILAALFIVDEKYYPAILLGNIATHTLWTVLGFCQMLIKWTGLFSLKMLILFGIYGFVAWAYKRKLKCSIKFTDIKSVILFLLCAVVASAGFVLSYTYVNYMTEINWNRSYASFVGDLSGILYISSFFFALYSLIKNKDFSFLSFISNKENYCKLSRDVILILASSFLFYLSSKYYDGMYNGSHRIFAFIPLLALALTRGFIGFSMGLFFSFPVYNYAIYYSDYTDEKIVSWQLSNLFVIALLLIISVIFDVLKNKRA
jgi:hypothetical protein